MMEFRKAYELVLKRSKPLGTEEVRIDRSTGRILAESVRSDTDMPPFDRAAMDGYAVRSSDIGDAPALLKVTGQIRAGVFFRGHVEAGTATAIMTGAPIPAGADAVVMVENTAQAGECFIRVNSPVKKGDNICRKGEDIRKGEVVLRRGQRVGAAQIALMASVGKRTVRVFRIPRVSVLATGDELVSHSRAIKKGRIRDCNSPMLASWLRSLGLHVTDLGIARDRCGELREKVSRGLKADLLILSGGVSMGQYDLVPRVFRDCGIKEIFHKVAIKPGKPVFFGRKGHVLVFGMPGNPVSVLVTFLLFVRPAIDRICGVKDISGHLRGLLSESFTTRGDRKTCYPVEVTFQDGGYRLRPVSYHGSADIRGAARADGFMIIEKGKRHVKKGESVEFILL